MLPGKIDKPEIGQKRQWRHEDDIVVSRELPKRRLRFESLQKRRFIANKHRRHWQVVPVLMLFREDLGVLLFSKLVDFLANAGNVFGQLRLTRLLVLCLDILKIRREDNLAVNNQPAVLSVAYLSIRAIRRNASLQKEVNTFLKSGLTKLFRKDLLPFAPLKAGIRRKRLADTGQLLGDVADAPDIFVNRLGKLGMFGLRLLRRRAENLKLLAKRLQNTFKLLRVLFCQIAALRLKRLGGKIRKLFLKRLDHLCEGLLLLLQEAFYFNILFTEHLCLLFVPVRQHLLDVLVLATQDGILLRNHPGTSLILIGKLPRAGGLLVRDQTFACCRLLRNRVRTGLVLGIN